FVATRRGALRCPATLHGRVRSPRTPSASGIHFAPPRKGNSPQAEPATEGAAVEHIASERISWARALKKEKPLLMPVAHDALTARLIERAGFSAVQIAGFAVAGARYGHPDIDITHYAERHAAVKDIMAATALPILVDADDGYGDVKNVTHTVRGYMALGIQGLFVEDQAAPKECGHMNDKKVVPAEQMVAKVKAAVAAKAEREFFILARTDA